MEPKHTPGKGPSRERRQRGRPRKFSADASHFSLRLDATLHDDLIREATRQGKEVSDYARELLDQGLRRRPS